MKIRSTNIVAKVPLNDMAWLRSGMILQQTRLWAPRTDDEMSLLNGAYTGNPPQPKSGSINPHPAPQQNHGHSVRKCSFSSRVQTVSSNIASAWFVCGQNTRPDDSVGGASTSSDDAACLRFSIIREQTIPCATRTGSEEPAVR